MLRAVIAWLALGLANVLSPNGGATAMTFRTEPVGTARDCRTACPRVVVADGVITKTTPADLANFIIANAHDRSFRNVILINSPGGSVMPAIQLGRMFRDLGSIVIVGQVEQGGGFGNDPRVGVPLKTGSCYSACLFALMGGKTRVVPAASVVGIHRIHTPGQIDVASRDKHMMYIFAEAPLVARMREYARQMGVDPAVIDLAESVGPDDLRRLTPAELKRFHLAQSEP